MEKESGVFNAATGKRYSQKAMWYQGIVRIINESYHIDDYDVFVSKEEEIIDHIIHFYEMINGKKERKVGFIIRQRIMHGKLCTVSYIVFRNLYDSEMYMFRNYLSFEKTTNGIRYRMQ